MASIWRENMLGYLSVDIICYSKLTVFLELRFSLLGTDNLQGKISEHIFAPNGGYCVYYPSNIFFCKRSFENWGLYRSRDAFRPIARERKYLMDYKSGHLLKPH